MNTLEIMKPKLEFEDCWQALIARDESSDGRFVYAVKSTGIYCRPTCPSRRPLPRSVEFFTGTVQAERAGYRACRRCRPTEVAPTRALIDKVSKYLRDHADETVTLAQLSAIAGVSPFHLQRTFRRALGISPKQFHASLRSERAKRSLRAAGSVTDAIYDAGFSSSSRFYSGASSELGMAPASYRRFGQGATIAYTVFPTKLGKVLLATTARGVCSIRIGADEDALKRELAAEFRAAESITSNPRELKPLAEQVTRFVAGLAHKLDLSLDIQATAFQRRVWMLLRKIGYGSTASYSQIAKKLGAASSVRAVARACASNPVALTIPCHRVVGSDGALKGYRWGVERKAALLAAERTAAPGSAQKKNAGEKVAGMHHTRS